MERLFSNNKSQQEALDSTGVLNMMGDFNDFLRSPTVQNTLTMSRSQMKTGRPDATPRAPPGEASSFLRSVGGTSTRSSAKSSQRGRDDFGGQRSNPDDSFASFLNTSSMSSNRKRRSEDIEAKANLVVAGVQNSRLESEVSGLQSTLKRVKTEQESSEQKHLSEVSRLQRQSGRVEETLRDENAALQQQLQATKRAFEVEKVRLEEQMILARHEATSAQRLGDQRREDCSRITAELELLSQQRAQHGNIAQTELDLLRQEAVQWKDRYDSSVAQVQALRPLEHEISVLQHEIETLKNNEQTHSEQAALSKSVSRQLTRLDQLEQRTEHLQAENNRLRLTQQNSALLQEKMTGLESKLARAEQRAADYEKLQLQYQELQEQHQQWSTLDQSGRPLDPTSVTRELAGLQQQQLVYVNRCNTLETRCKSCESQLQHTLARLETVEKDLISEKVAKAAIDEQAVRKERLNLFLTKERDGLRNILTSYQRLDNPSAESVAEIQLKEAGSNLERHREMIAALQSETESMTRSLATERLTCQQAVKSAEMCREQLKSGLKATLEPSAPDVAELQLLRMTVRRLEEELAVAATSAAAVKREDGLSGDGKFAVLHFEDNPLHRSREKLKKSQALEAASDSHEEVKALQEALAEEKKMRQRMEEVGRRKITELRSACKVFLGWKLDTLRHGHYELRSVYSTSHDDFLRIERNSAGELGLQPTPLATEMSAYITQHLANGGAWPCFLSAITLHLARQHS